MMAVQKTASGLLNIFQLLMLLRMMKSVDSVAAADPCQPQFPCVFGTKMGDQNNCRRYFECKYPENSRLSGATPDTREPRFKRSINLNNVREKPRWMPTVCYGNTYFSILESKCVYNSTRHCQKKCGGKFC